MSNDVNDNGKIDDFTYHAQIKGGGIYEVLIVVDLIGQKADCWMLLDTGKVINLHFDVKSWWCCHEFHHEVGI